MNYEGMITFSSLEEAIEKIYIDETYNSWEVFMIIKALELQGAVEIGGTLYVIENYN